MPKQGSLDSFFGTKPVKKKGPQQTKLNNFAVKKTPPNASNHPEKSSKRKTPDTADESDTTPHPVPTIRKRRVIDDDSDDDSMVVARAAHEPDRPKDEANKDAINELTSDNDKKTLKESQHMETSNEEKPTRNNKVVKNTTNISNNHEVAQPSSEKSASSTMSRKPQIPAILKASKDQFKSDDQILAEIPTNSEIPWEMTIPYNILCLCFAKIEAVTSRLAIQEIMTTLFRQVMLKCPSDLITILYLGSNSVAAAYECVELGIGDAILIKAIAEATGSSQNSIKEKYKEVGDLGSIAENCKSKQKTLGGFFTAKNSQNSTAKKYLSSCEVLACFREIAQTKGNQAQKFKAEKIKKLLFKATPIETKYIIRGLQGKLRIGLAESTVLISLAHALSLTVPSTMSDEQPDTDKSLPPEAVKYLDKNQPVEKRLEAAVAIVKKAYSEVPSYESILEAALHHPLEMLHRYCTLTPGIPVAPMLAKPTKSVQEVLKRLNGLKFTCEFKYDGERAQIHMLEDGKTKVFSRNLLDTSEKYPEVPIFVKEACHDVTSFVLDAEVVAFNKEKGQLVPFQVLSTRKKTEESAETAKVQVIVEAFDLMYLNGESLLDKKLIERRALLKKHFKPVEGKFQFATYLDHEENGDTTVLEEFLDSAVKGQCEGLMVKTLEVDAIYEPSRRSLNWLKLKKDYLEGLGDSVDLVPLGAYHGRGKRTGFYGAYLLACYDPDTEEFQSVCKIGTGFSDEDLKTLAENLNKHTIPTKSSQYNVTDQLECDVWFDAVEVWEVKAADLSKSSAHRGAIGKTGEEGRGIGLRFPRFERKRDDKRPDEATTSDQILEMYYDQDAIQGGDNGDDDGI